MYKALAILPVIAISFSALAEVSPACQSTARQVEARLAEVQFRDTRIAQFKKEVVTLRSLVAARHAGCPQTYLKNRMTKLQDEVKSAEKNLVVMQTAVHQIEAGTDDFTLFRIYSAVRKFIESRELEFLSKQDMVAKLKRDEQRLQGKVAEAKFAVANEVLKAERLASLSLEQNLEDQKVVAKQLAEEIAFARPVYEKLRADLRSDQTCSKEEVNQIRSAQQKLWKETGIRTIETMDWTVLESKLQNLDRIDDLDIHAILAIENKCAPNRSVSAEVR